MGKGWILQRGGIGLVEGRRRTPPASADDGMLWMHKFHADPFADQGLNARQAEMISYERFGRTFVEERQSWHAWLRWEADDLSGVPPVAVADRFLLTALDRIEADLSVFADLEGVASDAGLSPFHFHRRFAEVMGETFGAYVRRIRLEHAATIICRTSTGILDAALRTGYGSQPAFTRAFARRFGTTPNRMRTMAQAATPLPGVLHRNLADAASPMQQANAALIAMRCHGGLDLIPTHWRRFAQALQAAGFSLDGLQPVGILYDDPALTAPERMRYDCTVIDPGLTFPALRAPLRRIAMTAGAYASLPVQGPHRLLAEAVFAVCAVWMPRARRVFGEAPAYVAYVRPPWALGAHVDAVVRVPIDR